MVMQTSLFVAAILHFFVFAALAIVLTTRTVEGYMHPADLQHAVPVGGAVGLPVVTICPDEPLPSKLPKPPTCLYSLTQGHHTAPQPVSSRSVTTTIRSPTGHELEYACHECNADRRAPLPATGVSQLFVEVNRSGSDSAFAPTLIAFTGGAVDATLPFDQLDWLRLYQQESAIHQLTARRTERLFGGVHASVDVTAKSLPCHQATRGASCDGLSVLLVRYARLEVMLTREAPAIDGVLALCALAGAASCVLVSLRGVARLLTGARGMPSEAETLHLIAGQKPPPVFSDPYTGVTMK